MKHAFLNTVALNAVRIVAFDPGTLPNSFPPALPGQVNIGFINTLMMAAMAAAGQTEVASTEVDLSARDLASSAMLPYWDLTDDLITGEEAVVGRGDKYLPRFSDEPSSDYTGRLKQTKFTNVYSDVVEALAGKPFEEEVTLQPKKSDGGDEIPLPDDLADFVEDVDGAGNNLTSFAAATFFNGINSAIDWIYVDYPKVDPAVTRTLADQQAQNIRPFWSHVLGRNVLEATTQIINSKETLVRMRILEPGMPNNIRVFERTPDGVVTMGLYQEVISNNGRTKTFILIDSATITIGVIPLVPFATGRRDGRTFKFFPVMKGAADLQIQLYQQESALKFAKVMTAYPMLAANGMNPAIGPDGKTPLKLAVGPNRVLYSQRDGTSGNFGTWAYVSPDAACLTFLKSDVAETMNQLRELGRQPLTAQSGNLTVITTAYAAGKARSAVSAWAMRLKDALENAMNLTCLWLAMPTDVYEPEICIFDDFDDFTTDQASDHAALQFARTNGDLSHENYIMELKRRNTIRADFDDDENTKQLLTEVPDDTVPPDAVDDNGNPLPKPKDPANPQPGEAGYVKPTAKPPTPTKKLPTKKKVLA